MKEINGFEVVHLKPNAQNIEMWIAYDTDSKTAIGHIFMTIENNQRIKFLDAWVDESHRRRGIFRSLWETRWEFVNNNYKGYTVYAWCKDTSLPLLLEKGFEPGEIVTYVEKQI
jgi:hypothetical protein